MTAALVWVPCSRCGAACVCTPSRWLQALCQSCRPAPAIAPHSVPWRPTIARVLPGELGAILPSPIERRAAAERPAPRYRVLTPSRDATPDEIGKGPRAVLTALSENGDLTHVTYACAEDTERGELVRTIVVRVLGSGYGGWEEGAWSSGLATHPRPHLCGTLDEWLQHVRGLDYVPPSCPRCGRTPVRIKNDGQPYAHTRQGWHPPLRQECT